MSIRPKYGKRSVLQVLSDGMSQPPARFTRDDLPGFRSLLNAFTDDDPDTASYSQRLGVSRVMDAVVDHLNERGGVPAEKLHPEMAMTITAFPSDEDGPTMEDRIKEALSRTDFSFAKGGTVQRKSCCEDAALNAAEVGRLTRERDELQAKLDAAEWIGDLPNPGDIEVIKTQGYWAQGILVADADATPEQLRISNSVNDSISSAARREAVARFIDAEEAQRNDDEERIEEQAKALFRTLHPLSNWEENVHTHGRFRAAIRDGWPKEADK